MLFDEMASTYGTVNLVSSFGFAARWRSQAIDRLPTTSPFSRVADLMSGMGELWHSLARHSDRPREVVAVDISREMFRRSEVSQPFVVIQRIEDVLTSEFEPASFDAPVSSFGLKTFSAEQQSVLSLKVAYWLRPGGVFSFVEISVPTSRPLRLFYMLYINWFIPFLGRLFLGNPDHYRLLGTYTEAFGDCQHFASSLESAGLQVQFIRYFFGCATGVSGRKPEAL